MPISREFTNNKITAINSYCGIKFVLDADSAWLHVYQQCYNSEPLLMTMVNGPLLRQRQLRAVTLASSWLHHANHRQHGNIDWTERKDKGYKGEIYHGGADRLKPMYSTKDYDVYYWIYLFLCLRTWQMYDGMPQYSNIIN